MQGLKHVNCDPCVDESGIFFDKQVNTIAADALGPDSI